MEGPSRREHGMVQSGSVCVRVHVCVGSYVKHLAHLFIYILLYEEGG